MDEKTDRDYIVQWIANGIIAFQAGHSDAMPNASIVLVTGAQIPADKEHLLSEFMMQALVEKAQKIGVGVKIIGTTRQ